MIEGRRSHLRVAILCFTTVVFAGGEALAQARPERGGFTILVNLGVGVQNDAALEDSAVGLAGVNLGVGGFLTENAALMFRISGTNVSYGSFDQLSGVAGPSLQYWASDRFNVEAGVGIGFWTISGEPTRGLGLIVGSGVTIFNWRKHNLQVGVEYAPAFTSPGTVHNVGITFGYQFL